MNKATTINEIEIIDKAVKITRLYEIVYAVVTDHSGVYTKLSISDCEKISADISKAIVNQS